jgi:GH25 family lysozyme M1 (1,4-beta-N-acetylmuramidase)
VSLTRRSGAARLRRRTAVAVTALAVMGGALTTGVTAAQAEIVTPDGSSYVSMYASTHASRHASTNASTQAHVVYAMTATGQKVPVAKPTFAATPVHPEKITHPGRDFMGSTVAAHFHGPRVSASAVKANSVPQLPGIDVSAYQGDINWKSVCPHIDFSYAKATEGTYYTNPDFYNQYVGPYDCPLIRGAYHFAIPSNSRGKTQADYFVAHGGGWSGDGRTLPGALDIEYNPYGSECYGLTQSQMESWIWGFVDEYAYREHAYPVIYTTADWWRTCEGNRGTFYRVDPLWIANYSASGGGPRPSGWGTYTFWQYRDSGSLPGDQDVFNGAYTQLKVLADRG